MMLHCRHGNFRCDDVTTVKQEAHSVSLLRNLFLYVTLQEIFDLLVCSKCQCVFVSLLLLFFLPSLPLFLCLLRLLLLALVLLVLLVLVLPLLPLLLTSIMKTLDARLTLAHARFWCVRWWSYNFISSHKACCLLV